MPAPGDDDDIIIHRVQHNSSTDTMTPITTTRALFGNLLGFIAPATIPDQPTKALYTASEALVT